MLNKLLLILLSITFSSALLSQTNFKTKDPIKSIRLLKNNTYEIKEYTCDSVLIYKGILNSVNPEIRHGKFYFYNQSGKVIATGLYNYDIPYGTWVYYDENFDTIQSLDYSSVLSYLKTDAIDYKFDSTVLNKLKKRDKKYMNPDGTFYSVETMPLFNGGDPEIEFSKYIQENMIMPIYTLNKISSQDVVIEFIIDDKGYIRNPKIVNSNSTDFNMEALRILEESQKWEPARQGGYPVSVVYSWPFKFRQGITRNVFPINYESENYKLPLFMGLPPEIEFRKYIAGILQYPEKAAVKHITGRVVVKFIVREDGSLDEIEVTQSVCPSLDAEAVRVVSKSPEWQPAKIDGKSISTIMVFPINFVLE